MMVAVQEARFAALALSLSLCCALSSALSYGKAADSAWNGVESVVSRQGDTALLRCYLSDGLSKGAWLNRSSIIFAGEDKWSVDPRVSIVSGTGSKHEYSLQIQKVDVTDDGQYTCSVQSDHNPQSNHIHLSVKGHNNGWLLDDVNICRSEGARVSHLYVPKLVQDKSKPQNSFRQLGDIRFKQRHRTSFVPSVARPC